VCVWVIQNKKRDEEKKAKKKILVFGANLQEKCFSKKFEIKTNNSDDALAMQNKT
jgi:hypothetical protein